MNSITYIATVAGALCLCGGVFVFLKFRGNAPNAIKVEEIQEWISNHASTSNIVIQFGIDKNYNSNLVDGDIELERKSHFSTENPMPPRLSKVSQQLKSGDDEPFYSLKGE